MDIYNNLHKISSLKGVEYYSVTRERMRVLFEDGYRINSNGKKVADTSFNIIPRFVSYDVIKNDVNFGKNRYRVDYYYFERESIIVMVFRNIDRLRYFKIPMVNSQSFYTISIIKPKNDEIEYYGLSAANTVGFMGIQQRKTDSFYNRINAILQWAISFYY